MKCRIETRGQWEGHITYPEGRVYASKDMQRQVTALIDNDLPHIRIAVQQVNVNEPFEIVIALAEGSLSEWRNRHFPE